MGHGKEVDLVENLDCKGLLWEEDMIKFLAGGRRLKLGEWIWRRHEGWKNQLPMGLTFQR